MKFFSPFKKSNLTFKNIDYDEYYTTRDPDLLASNFTTNLAILAASWRHLLGRPLCVLLATHSLLGNFIFPASQSHPFYT